MPEFRQRLHREVIDETYPRLHEMLRPLSQDDIDDAIRAWNGDIQSKHAVVRYMEQHGREKDTAAWLAQEYSGNDSKSLFVIRAGSPEGIELPWPKVQRRIAQLIKEDRFYTEAEQDRFDNIDPITIREALAERGIVNGELVDEEKLNNDPFIQRMMADVEQIAAEEQDQLNQSLSDAEYARHNLIPGETTFALDGRTFRVSKLEPDIGRVELQDVTFANAVGFPIFRVEPISVIRQHLEQEPEPAQPSFTTEPVAVYPGDKNHLPYPHSAAYAREHGEMAQYNLSYQANSACKEAIEQTISAHYAENRLDTEAAVKDVLEKFGTERVQFILANTIQRKNYDGRISQDNKAWAKTIPMLEDSGASRHCAYLVVDQVNPGLTDLFTRQFRKVAQEQQKSSVLQKLKQELPAHKSAAPKKREPER